MCGMTIAMLPYQRLLLCYKLILKHISPVSHQSDSCEIAPTTLSNITECAQTIPQPAAPISVAPDAAEDRSTSHRNSYLFDNIYHLMHLSRAKREPHIRRRHKHLLFEKHDIHLHPHFFHRLAIPARLLRFSKYIVLSTFFGKQRFHSSKYDSVYFLNTV